MKRNYLIIFLLLLGSASISSAQQLSLQWAQRYGQSGWDYVNDLVTTTTGNYIFGGSLKGVLPGDSIHPALEFSYNAYLASCDTNGNLLWQKTYGGSMFDNITSMIRTSEGIMITGLFQDTIRFDNLSAVTTAFTGAYIVKTDEQGNPQWLRKTGGMATIKHILLSVNSLGQVFMAGSFTDSLQLAGQQKAIPGDRGLFLTTIQSDGSESNPVVFKSTGNCTLGGISSTDNLICLAGSFSDTLHINDTIIVSYGEEDIFVAMFNQSGELKHLITAGGIGNEQVNAVSFSPNDELGITGSFDYSILMGDKIVQTKGGKDIFIAVLDTTGNLKWIRSIGGMGDDYGYTITAPNESDFFVSGNFVHYLQMPDENGNMVEMEAGSPFGNAFIAKYNADGDLKASYNLPATSEDYCKSLLVNDRGMIIAAGNYYQTMQLQRINGFTTELQTEGERDIFLIRFMDLCKDVTVDAGIDTMLCPGQSIFLTAPQPYPFYQWLPGGSPNHGLEVTQAGIYKLLITDEHGCIASDSLTLGMHQLPVVFAGNDTIVQPGESLQLEKATTSNTLTVEWKTAGTGYFGNSTELSTYYSPSFADISEGTIPLTLVATNQCGTTSDNLILSIPQDADGITAFPNPTQGSVTLVCTEGITIQSASITTQYGTVIEPMFTVNGTVMQYNLSNYPPGAFLFHLSIGNTTVTKIINKL